MEDVVQPASRSSSSESIERPRSLSALVFEKSLNESDGFQSPILRAFTRNIIKKWRGSKERAINKRLREVKTEKKRREAESKEVARLITRTVPLDLLAKEWMDNNNITVDVRIYLVEKLLPTLILGIEKLLNEVSDRNLADSEGFCPDFNPINTLAQYLMRNNPKYSNLLESSPYAKGLKKVVEDLKKEIYSTEENQLAKIKAEAKKKREERELIERMKDAEDRRRSYAIEEQFPEWTSDWKGFIPLAVVSNENNYRFINYYYIIYNMLLYSTNYDIGSKCPAIISRACFINVRRDQKRYLINYSKTDQITSVINTIYNIVLGRRGGMCYTSNCMLTKK